MWGGWLHNAAASVHLMQQTALDLRIRQPGNFCFRPVYNLSHPSTFVFARQNVQLLIIMASPSDPKPRVCLLNLDNPEFFNNMYTHFVRVLRDKSQSENITTPEQAKAAFTSSPPPEFILSVDGSLTSHTHSSLVEEALSYVRAGGSLLFMGHFPSSTHPFDIANLFSRFDLRWASGDYHRTTVELNPSVTHFDTSQCVESYSLKALHLRHVANKDAIYLPTEFSRVESVVFSPEPVGDLTQTPAALAEFGRGKVGYIGDVNNEAGTMLLVMVICGIYPK